MSDGNAAVQEKLAELSRLFHERIERDEVQQRAFDQLYEELRQYKEDFIFQMEKPFLLDLLLFYDSLAWFQQSLTNREMPPENISDSFQYLIDEFLEVLYRRDVVPCEVQERFDMKTHKAVKVLPTDNPADDWKVQTVLKRGFIRGNRVLRPEEVAILRNGTDGRPDRPARE